jgi:RNA polymerase sigma-70 factor (ECF subfamily)
MSRGWEGKIRDVTFTDLFEEFEEGLRRYTTGLVRDSYKADDLVQETFIRAMANLELLGQLNHYQRRAWLYRVAKNLFLDEQNRSRREQALVEQLSYGVQLISYPMLGLVSSDLFERIPEHYRDLLHKRYVLGMTSKEIAGELGIPAATVRSRLHLAVKWLRANKSRFV